MTKRTASLMIFACAAGLASAAPGAMAQTSKAQPAHARPAAAAAIFACAFSVIELAPVSEDTNGRPTAWVMVHRVNGEVVAAERVSPREVEQIRSHPCGRKPDAATPLVG